MSAGDAKLDRLQAGLSPRERVVLMQRALLAGEREDAALRNSAPPGHAAELNHFVALANGILHVLLPQGLALAAEVDLLCERALLLNVLVAWGFERGSLAFDASILARVPIAASEHAAKLAEARDEYLPLRDAAEFVADARDLAPNAAVAALRDAEQAIPSRRRGKALEFQIGPLCDWLGIDVPFGPDWGMHYLVVPDAELPTHKLESQAAKRFERLSEDGVPWPPSVLPALASKMGMTSLPERATTHLGEAMRLLAMRLRTDVPEHWSRLLAFERVVGEVTAEFEDESVLPEMLPDAIARAREALLELVEHMPDAVGEIVLPDADETIGELYRRALHRDERSPL